MLTINEHSIEKFTPISLIEMTLFHANFLCIDNNDEKTFFVCKSLGSTAAFAADFHHSYFQQVSTLAANDVNQLRHTV